MNQDNQNGSQQLHACWIMFFKINETMYNNGYQFIDFEGFT